jgi:hypothetical protein
MGRYAATNIVKLLLATEDGDVTVKLATCPAFPASMSLAIGEYAIGLRSDGMRWGKDVMQRAFGRGLGIEGEFHWANRLELGAWDILTGRLGTLKKLKLKPAALEVENGVHQIQQNHAEKQPAPIAANM